MRRDRPRWPWWQYVVFPLAILATIAYGVALWPLDTLLGLVAAGWARLRGQERAADREKPGM